MNNPLRFSGDTFYQSGYFRDPETGFESTTLSVVSNNSWMLPYVACMIVAIGMLFHFGAALLQFLKSRSFEQISRRQTHVDNLNGPARPWAGSRLTWWMPGLVVLVMAGWIISKAIPPRDIPGQMQLYKFGELPVVYQGRIKPLDTLAQTACESSPTDRRSSTNKVRNNRQSAGYWI